ncbi:hypothetical protein SEA_LEOPARD_54 [Mycobacterium phage Leopard]|uniref:Uncharacterized protein n=1 Tax=Mycobacterium phage Onyinye TaxID=2686235 RepID=A0A6B9L7G8_9CAUD|nr:hypothetical protein PP339_gp055 [Mycobacterium phage Onyinye]QHB37460.1 hypothetical protein SEA_ONYINYE_55 [Mycobacterium phage Onyinye]UOW92931.1 hypothetical protein SEA_LEOPARD_54 [Mycobacterium phage Leopard]WKW85217.1 hypothetical protein SEA_AIKOY__55 [Mycobacterium phage Aikoy]
MNGIAEKLASPKQLKWLRDLLEDKDFSDFPEDWRKACDRIREMFNGCAAAGYEAPDLNTYIVANDGIPLTHNDFQKLLPKLQAAPKAKKAIHDEQATKNKALIDGYYLRDGVYYRVVHNRSKTKQYAQRMKFLMSLEEAKAKAGQGVKGKVFKWEYAPGAIYKLAPNMLVTNTDLTEQFGGLYSACCECGALLNDPLSVALNIGPVCGGRVFGEEWKGMLKEAKGILKAKAQLS